METSQIGLPADIVSKTIENSDGSKDVYHIKLLPVEDCWTAVEQTIEFMAPVIGTWLDDSDGLGEDTGMQIGILISQNMRGLELVKWAKVFLSGATKNGQKFDVLSLRGAKGMKVTKELFLFAYKENCLDFLVGELESMGLNVPSIEEIQLKVTTSERSSEK